MQMKMQKHTHTYAHEFQLLGMHVQHVVYVRFRLFPEQHVFFASSFRTTSFVGARPFAFCCACAGVLQERSFR